MAIRILDDIKVTAATADGAGADALPLTYFDVVWLPTGPVERVLFFPVADLTTANFVADFLPLLISSLSSTLSLFPFFSSHLTSPRPPFSLTPSSSFTLLLAESSDGDAAFRQLSGDSPRSFQELYSLIPQLPPNALSAIQVTVFPLHGFTVGVAVHHVVCDDSSAVLFLKSWAAACRGGATVAPNPIHDRSLIPDPTGLCSRILHEMLQLGPPPPPSPPPPEMPPKTDKVIATFSVGRDFIDRAKQLASARAGKAAHCSAFTVACALAWVCQLRSQNRHNQQKVHLLFSVDCRARLSPPVPAEYFGNCLRPCFVEIGVSELLGGDEGVVVAAEAIGESIKSMEEGLLEGAEGWLQKIVSILPEQPMSVGGSPKNGVYEVDFGWGRPCKADMLSIEKTPGTISLAEGRDGGGGVEIGVVLPAMEMEKFRSCFHDELSKLI